MSLKINGKEFRFCNITFFEAETVIYIRDNFYFQWSWLLLWVSFTSLNNVDKTKILCFSLSKYHKVLSHVSIIKNASNTNLN